MSGRELHRVAILAFEYYRRSRYDHTSMQLAVVNCATWMNIQGRRLFVSLAFGAFSLSPLANAGIDLASHLVNSPCALFICLVVDAARAGDRTLQSGPARRVD